MKSEKTEHRTREATEARISQGQNTDSKVLKIISSNPGLSSYQITKLAGSSNGLIDGSINRLRAKDAIDIRDVLRDGRRIREIYPKGFVHYHEPVIKFGIADISQPENWKDTAQLYALDRITLGVAPQEEKEWTEKAFAKFDVPLTKDGRGHISVPVPEELQRFYMWGNSSSDVSTVDDLVIVTLKTEIPIVDNTPSENST